MPKEARAKLPLTLTKKVQQGPVLEVVKHLTDLDLLAIAILRFKTEKTPALVNISTVAIAQVGGEYWYAMNYMNTVTSVDVQKIYNCVGSCDRDIDSYYVYEEDKEVDKATHAEIKLLNQLRRERIEPAKVRIGISKPACKDCLKALTTAGIKPSWTHLR